jgi:hypothetical protein
VDEDEEIPSAGLLDFALGSLFDLFCREDDADPRLARN